MQQEFLTVLSLADEFTIEMAKAVTGRADAAELLADLTTRNAFVKRLPDSDRYRCHHVMKHCAMRAFHKLPAEKHFGINTPFASSYLSVSSNSPVLLFFILTVYSESSVKAAS